MSAECLRTLPRDWPIVGLNAKNGEAWRMPGQDRSLRSLGQRPRGHPAGGAAAMTDEELLRDGTLPVFARREHLLVDCISGPQRVAHLRRGRGCGPGCRWPFWPCWRVSPVRAAEPDPRASVHAPHILGQARIYPLVRYLGPSGEFFAAGRFAPTAACTCRQGEASFAALSRDRQADCSGREGFNSPLAHV